MTLFGRPTNTPSGYNVYVYVDGESHYYRSREFCKKLYGSSFELNDLKTEWEVTVHPRCTFFWDSEMVTQMRHVMTRYLTPSRLVCFTSFSGAAEDLHDARVRIKKCGLEPYVIHEPKNLESSRENVLNKTGILEKAKGVDIGLTVRLLEDARHNNFDACAIFTSDIDYLPAIEAVRRMGKLVAVAGYRSGMSDKSPFEYIPDGFFDLEGYIRETYEPQKDASAQNPAPAPTARPMQRPKESGTQ